MASDSIESPIDRATPVYYSPPDMSMIEGMGKQLQEAAGTHAPQTLAKALHNFEQAHAGFAAVAEGSDDPAAAETLRALAAARTRTEEAIGYALGGIVAVREYAQSVGINLGSADAAPTIPTEPTTDSSDSSAVKWPSESDVAEEASSARISAAARQRVRAIQLAIDRGVAPSMLRGHIKSGHERHVFRLPDGNVLKLTFIDERDRHNWGELLYAQRQYVAAMRRADSQKGFEQFVDWADEVNGSPICREVPGKTLEDMSSAELLAIPPEHFDELMAIMKKAAELRIDIDYHPSNVMYDPQVGFTLIDYVAADSGSPSYGAEWIATSVGSPEVLFSEMVIEAGDYATLAAVGKRFHTAFEKAFGPEGARHLRQNWQVRNFVMPMELW